MRLGEQLSGNREAVDSAALVVLLQHSEPRRESERMRFFCWIIGHRWRWRVGIDWRGGESDAHYCCARCGERR